MTHRRHGPHRAGRAPHLRSHAPYPEAVCGGSATPSISRSSRAAMGNRAVGVDAEQVAVV